MLFVSLCLLVGAVMGQARLLNQCLGITITMGVLLMLVPGLNLIGLLLIAFSGARILAGKCKTCKPLQVLPPTVK